MELNETQQKMAERIGELLAESPLDEDMKQVILDGLDKLPEHMLVKLLDVLERESNELERFAAEVESFLASQEDNWDKTSKEQEKFAQELIERLAKEIE